MALKFINVVSFQSFNSHLATGLGCRTYSFTPRLGVYVMGSPGEDRLKRDKAGRLRPYEFTERLAHRVSQHIVEVVEILPVGRDGAKNREPAGRAFSNRHGSSLAVTGGTQFRAEEKPSRP